jgi:putative heme-binding domain-containing protein
MAMNHRTYSWRSFLKVAPILGFSLALASHAQSLPEGPGKAEFQRTCSGCHVITVVTAQRLNQSGWENVVDNMVSRGAQASPDELQQIVRYLTANFGGDSPASKIAAPGQSSVPAQTRPALVLDPSQIARAKEIIETSGCLSCHRMDGNGSFAGPDLGDVGATHSAEQIRASLVSPRNELAPQNRSVRLVTQDGTTVVGSLLNQDGFSVQLIDASGHLRSFERANLRDFTIVTANSMPSYAHKMGSEDLSLLVKYLETLAGTTPQ